MNVFYDYERVRRNHIIFLVLSILAFICFFLPILRVADFEFSLQKFTMLSRNDLERESFSNMFSSGKALRGAFFFFVPIINMILWFLNVTRDYRFLKGTYIMNLLFWAWGTRFLFRFIRAIKKVSGLDGEVGGVKFEAPATAYLFLVIAAVFAIFSAKEVYFNRKS